MNPNVVSVIDVKMVHKRSPRFPFLNDKYRLQPPTGKGSYFPLMQE